MKFAFTAKVLGIHPADYDVCDACGFLQALNPNWPEEAYSPAIAADGTDWVIR